MVEINPLKLKKKEKKMSTKPQKINWKKSKNGYRIFNVNHERFLQEINKKLSNSVFLRKQLA